jgi:pimeloyl-ACP methyl ester carboxylesterase
VTHATFVPGAAGQGSDMSLHRAADWRASYAATFPEAQGWARDDVPDRSDRLAQIAVPVLLLWATRDPVSPISIAETLKSRIPRAVTGHVRH